MGQNGVRQGIGSIDSDEKFSLLYPGYKLPKVVRIFLDIRKAIRACQK